MSKIRFLRSANFKLTALYVLLFGASSLVVFGVIYWIIAGTLQQQMALIVKAEISELEQDYRVGRTAGLAQEIETRIGSGRYPFNYYLLQDKSGKKLVGNLPSMAAFEGWQDIPAPYPSVADNATDLTETSEHRAYAHGNHLDDGAFILVGTSTYQADESKEAIMRAFFWAIGVVLVLAFGGGTILSLSFLRRIDEINRTAKAIVDGQLNERVRTSGTKDELDLLAVNLNDMLDRIQALMESLQQVSNDIAHDLRRPLGRLRRHLEGVRRDAGSVEDYQTAIEKGIVETDDILATFSSLLRIAQIEAHVRRHAFRRVDLSAVFETVIDAYGPVIEDAGKLIEIDITPEIVIDGDRELLAQLLANLIENTVTHTPSGTSICLSLQQTQDGPVATLCDDGPGIPESERGKIFERFYRLDASRTTPGNGLGLALVAAVAGLHGASVAVTDNHPGAIFMVRYKSA